MAQAAEGSSGAHQGGAHFERFVVHPLLRVVEMAAAFLLALDLVVVSGSVLSRFVLDAPLAWADDVARVLLLAVSFLGAAAALAHGENVGVTFFVDRLPLRARRIVDATVGVLIVIVAAAFFWYSAMLFESTRGQTVGAGIPQEAFFGPMCIAGAAMTIFGLGQLLRHEPVKIAAGLAIVVLIAGLWIAVSSLWEDAAPDEFTLMLVAFLAALAAAMPIGLVLALSALVYVWTGDTLPGQIFAQQMARGIDNFVLLAVPFFILVGYLMEANGMSVRLIALLQRGIGRMRGGLNVVMVLSMVIFSGISGSKMADVAAVGSVLIPAARKSRQDPGLTTHHFSRPSREVVGR